MEQAKRLGKLEAMIKIRIIELEARAENSLEYLHLKENKEAALSVIEWQKEEVSRLREMLREA